MEDGLYLIACAFSFCMGAVVSSFLNVVIWRVPRGESMVSPPSHCPKCGAGIRWWMNVPILSYLALRGKCASCRAPISPRYPFVEALGGALFLASFLRNGVSPETLVWWVWISLMIVGSFIDFDHKLLPDFVTVGGMVLGLAVGIAVSLVRFAGFSGSWAAAFAPLWWSAGGLAFGFGLMWLVRFLGSKAFGREAMGMGDVFLMGAVGALFGPVAVLVTLILSSILGSVAGLGLIALSKFKVARFVEIPYGPYICMGALAWMFCGGEIVYWYLNLFARG